MQYTAVIERCKDTGFYVGYIPGIAGAHSQAQSLEELNTNLKEVMAMILEDQKEVNSDFIGTQQIVIDDV